jgi:hypothetical protein
LAFLLEAQCVLCTRYEINLFLSACLSVYLLAGMLCRESYHDSFSAVSRCVSLRIPPASCNACRDRRFGGLYLLRVKVGRSPEMVDVRLRGQAISTFSPPPVLRLLRFSSCTTFSVVTVCLQQFVLRCRAVCVRFVTQVAVF